MESKGRPGLGEMREESALNMFRQMDLKGKSKDDTQLKTVHQNTIATLRTYDEAGGAVKKFSCEFFWLRTKNKDLQHTDSLQQAV
jgi:actin related protein 2/3 complex subunit 1A/1B